MREFDRDRITRLAERCAREFYIADSEHVEVADPLKGDRQALRAQVGHLADRDDVRKLFRAAYREQLRELVEGGEVSA